MSTDLSTPPQVDASFPVSISRPRTSPSAARWNALMRLTRKVHLYSGLFMFPWVILYGVTALLFNHPTVFNSQSPRFYGSAEIAGTPLEGLPEAQELAAQVVKSMQLARGSDAQGPELRLVESEPARFARSSALVTMHGGNERHAVSVDLSSGTGSIRSRPIDGPADVQKPAPFPTREIKAASEMGEKLRTGVPALLQQMDLPSDDLVSVAVPDLMFHVEADGEVWRVAYNSERGTLAAKPAEQARPDGFTRQFLLRLHTAHGYPESGGARWFWAIAVDAMFVSMVFWGVSGLFMWWQLKATRNWGVVALAASAVVATLLAVGMHGEIAAQMDASPLTTEPVRRGRSPGENPGKGKSEERPDTKGRQRAAEAKT